MNGLHLGTQGFAYKDWLGVFYPTGMASGEYLRFYSQLFDTVELDTTFYGPPRPETVRSWRTSTPENFTFACKMPKSITHDKRLLNAEPELVEFLTAMTELGQKLGPVLVQLPPSFDIDEWDSLAAFLEVLPEEFRYGIELRHPSWMVEQTERLLIQHSVAWVNVDLPSMPRTTKVTTDFSYVRWLGNRSDVSRLDRVVVDRASDISYWAVELDRISRRVQRIYGYVNNHYAGHSPATVRELQAKLNTAPSDPRSLWGQRTLNI